LPEFGHAFGDAALLRQALTHRSGGRRHNERLEFLGDAMLGAIVAAELHERAPARSESELSLMRVALVRREALAEVARSIGLAACLRVGRAERSAAVAGIDSVLAGALEAVVGAAYLDGGYEAARRVVLHLLATPLSRVLDAGPAKDAKSRLQELLQARGQPLPVYAASGGPPYTVTCTTHAGVAASGTGASIRGAAMAAAERVLDMLERRT
jgi:ribonuclease-3